MAFRRLATNAINSLPISTKSAIFGTVKLNPDKWKRAGSGRDDFELVSVTEVLAKNGSPQRRLVGENRFWAENSDGQVSALYSIETYMNIHKSRKKDLNSYSNSINLKYASAEYIRCQFSIVS